MYFHDANGEKMRQQVNVPASQPTKIDSSKDLPAPGDTLAPEEELVISPMETLREVLENAQDASYKRNLVTNAYEYLSPAFTRISGHRVEDLLSLSLAATLDLIHPEDLPGLERKMAEALQDTMANANSVEYRFRHKDGHYICLLDRFTVLRNMGHQPIALIGSVSDITQNRMLTDDLEQYRSNLQAIFESTSDLIWSVDLDHRLVTFNESLNAHFRDNWGIELRTGSRADEHLPPDRATVWGPLYDRAIAEGPFHLEQLLQGGHVLDFSFNPVRRGQEIIGVSVFGKDITEQRRAEEALKEGEFQFKEALDNLPIPVSIYQGRKIIHINKEFVNVFGYDAEEISTIDDWMQLAYPNAANRQETADRWTEDMTHSLQSGKVTPNREYIVTCKDQSRKCMIISGRQFGAQTLVSFIDITERKAVVNALRKQVEFINTILENSPIGFAVYTLSDGLIQFVSSRFEEIYGVARGTVSSVDTFYEKVFLDPTFREEIRTRVTSDILSGDPARMRWEDVPVHSASGQVRYVTGINIPLEDHDLIVSTVQDVTLRKHMEGELLAYQTNLMALVESTDDMIWSVDRGGSLVVFNTAFANYLLDFYGTRARAGAKAEDLLPIDRAERWPAHYRQTIDEGPFHIEFTFRDGRIRDLSFNRVFRGETIVGVSVFGKDITPSKEAERVIREREAKFNKIFNSVPLAVSISTKDNGELLEVNESYLKLTGYRREEVIGRTASDLNFWLMENDRSRYLEKAAREALFEFQFKMRNGEIRNFIVSVETIDLDGKDCALNILTDITERMEAEAASANLRTQLNHLQRLESVGRLAGGISHDMNNVLGAVMAVAELLRMKGGEDLQLVEMILDAVRRGRNLLKGLMVFARKEMEEAEYFDLNDLIQKEAKLLAPTMLQRIRLELALAPKLPRMMGASSALSTALMNLCVNAMDAMPNGGTLTLRSRRLDDQRVELIVQDTGQGMPPEVISRAMEPFYTTKPVGKGTGLGLSMVFATVQAHGGSIELRSQIGLGTEVRITLPIIPGDSANLAPTATLTTTKANRELKLLLVDDDQLNREAAKGLLESQGHQVTEAVGGYEALGMIEHGAGWDLVVLDMNMPGINGLETLKKLRKICPDLPVIAASGYLDDFIRAGLGEMDRISILPKPYSLEEFENALAQLF